MKKKIIWNTYTLYEKPAVGTCELSGAYETGRFFIEEESNKRVFVGNTAAQESVNDYIGFLTALGTIDEFKRGYSRRERKAERLPPVKKKKKPAKK